MEGERGGEEGGKQGDMKRSGGTKNFLLWCSSHIAVEIIIL
jgi:hypothetical protein